MHSLPPSLLPPVHAPSLTPEPRSPPGPRYCSRAHQKADRTRHRTSCNLIKTSLDKLAAEEAALRAHDAGDASAPPPPNPLETAAGRLWHRPGGRAYMRARHDAATAQLNVRTGEAVQAALGHLRDMLRLCRGDNMGVRGQVPALLLRLGRDQEAWDFVLWWWGAGPGGYDWADPALPFLDLRGADAFADVGDAAGVADLSFMSAVMLVKTRLFVDLASLNHMAAELGEGAPADRVGLVREVCMSDVLLHRPDVVNEPDLMPMMTRLKEQIVKLYGEIDKYNKYFWPALMNPEKYSHATPGIYTFHSEAETVLAFRQSWYSWSESPGALDVLKMMASGEVPSTG